MRAALFLLFFLFVQHKIYAQSNEYSFMTTSVLQNLKAEVVKKADYATAAQIQIELDIRATDTKTLGELKKQLDVAVNAQDFSKAAQIQSEMKVINEKNDLRLKIEESLKKEDYKSAADAKEKLKKILDGNSSSTPTNSTNLVPEEKSVNAKVEDKKQGTTAQPNPPITSSSDDQRLSRGFTAWSCGLNAPLGLMFGNLKTKGVGYYLNYRFNLSSYETVDYKMVDGVIDDNYWIFDYNGVSKYSRLEVHVGLTTRITGDLDEFGLFAYSGVGVAQYRYLYEFDKIGPATGIDYGPSLIVDQNYSGWNANIEGGLLLNYKRFNFHSGVVMGIPSFAQSMFVIGVGISSK